MKILKYSKPFDALRALTFFITQGVRQYPGYGLYIRYEDCLLQWSWCVCALLVNLLNKTRVHWPWPLVTLKVHEAVEKKQTLKVVFFPGQKGQGKLTFPELKYRNLWDSIGCGGSQKCEIAYVEHMRAQFGSAWEYEEIDVARFLEKEFPMHSVVDAKYGDTWRRGRLLMTVPSFDDHVLTKSAESKWIVKCKETQQIFVSRHIRHATDAIYNLMDNGGHDALKNALQSAIPKKNQAELPFRSRLPHGTPSIAFNVKAEEIETVQVLRDKVLSGELNLKMRQSLAQDPHASADIEVDQSEFLEAYERSLQRLSKLTDHQQEKLAELKEPNQDLHLTAPAGGGGKTFVAAKYVLERLQRNPKGLVLYVCPCISLGLYFLRWLARWHAAETKGSTRAAMETLMERVVMLEKPYEKFILLNIQGDLIVQTPAAPVSQSVTTNQKLDFMLAVFDEGHEVLRHRNILDGISSQTILLLSDTSQSSETSQRFPSIKRVALTQVVRSTKRIVRGAAAFQLSDEGQHTTSVGTDGPPLKCFIFKSDAEITPGGFKHEYVEFIMKAFWHVAQTFSSLRSFNNRIALLVPNDIFVKKLKGPLQEELDHSFRQRNLRLFSFNESLSFLPTEFPEAKDEVIILDTVDRSRGHEAFIVICIGLDEAIEGQGAEVDLATRAQLYVGISRAQFMAIVVNCHVPGGWLEFLTKLEFKKSKFEETSGRAEIRTNAAAETLKVSCRTSNGC